MTWQTLFHHSPGDYYAYRVSQKSRSINEDLEQDSNFAKFWWEKDSTFSLSHWDLSADLVPKQFEAWIHFPPYHRVSVLVLDNRLSLAILQRKMHEDFSSSNFTTQLLSTILKQLISSEKSHLVYSDSDRMLESGIQFSLISHYSWKLNDSFCRK